MADGTYQPLGETALENQVSVQIASFVEPIPFAVDEWFRGQLQFARENIYMSEAAIREFLMVPVLREVWKAYCESLQFWPHTPFDAAKPALGISDYYFSRRSRLGLVQDQPPVVVVVQAKKDDFDGGWGQCLAAMLAAQEFNGQPPRIIYGSVSNGSLWQFGKLQDRHFIQEFRGFVLSDLPGLFAAWNYIFAQAKQQALAPAA